MPPCVCTRAYLNDSPNAWYSSWQVNAHIYDRNTNTHWALMQSSQESNGWLSYRLCVLGSGRKKRTYDLRWSRSEQRFAGSTDAMDFADYLPALKTNRPSTCCGQPIHLQYYITDYGTIGIECDGCSAADTSSNSG